MTLRQIIDESIDLRIKELYPDNAGCVLPGLECDEQASCAELSEAVAVAQQLSYYDLFLLHLTSAPKLFVIADAVLLLSGYVLNPLKK